MVARMNPQTGEALREYHAPSRHDAEIFSFPVTEWDRLELWRRRQEAKEERVLAARNEALSGI